MSLPLFHVDAFTDRPFAGNPAAVCPLETWPEDDLLRAIAAENNLSETAYFVAESDHFRLRWFTPQCEVNLCGHATLASAFVLLNILEPQRELVHFKTRSGPLTVRRDGDMFAMDFPALPPWKCALPPHELIVGLGAGTSFIPLSVVQLKDNYFVIYQSEEEVRSLRPDFRELEKLHPAGVAVTAPGKNVDFVSRYFAPSYGIPEDPVTGSTHCSLTPYWAERLGKNKLHARQVSERGGELWCELAGDRVVIQGNAVLTLQGSLLIGKGWRLWLEA
jgi:predicted PhzF superfamily epimerase YddE/YHI9